MLVEKVIGEQSDENNIKYLKSLPPGANFGNL
jgi:hypothetical protein